MKIQLVIGDAVVEIKGPPSRPSIPGPGSLKISDGGEGSEVEVMIDEADAKQLIRALDTLFF